MAPVAATSSATALTWSLWPWVQTTRHDPAIVDGGEDGVGVVCGVNDEHLALVADQPDVVVDLPRPPSSSKTPAVTTRSTRTPARRGAHRHPDVGRHARAAP